MPTIDNVTVLHSKEEFINAAIELIGQGSRYIRIRSSMLDPDLFNNPAVNEALSAFARQSRHAQVQILLDYPYKLLQIDHTSLTIIRRLSPKVVVKQYFQEPEENRETTILCDNRGVLVKYPGDDKEGYFSLTDAVYNRHAREAFEYDWDRSIIASELLGFVL